MDESDRFMSTEELSAFLGVAVPTIYNWRTKHIGPRGIKIGRTTKYRIREVERWLTEKERAAA